MNQILAIKEVLKKRAQLTNQTELLDERDIYKVVAQELFHTPYENVTYEQRNFAKEVCTTVSLVCHYDGNLRAFATALLLFDAAFPKMSDLPINAS